MLRGCPYRSSAQRSQISIGVYVCNNNAGAFVFIYIMTYPGYIGTAININISNNITNAKTSGIFALTVIGIGLKYDIPLFAITSNLRSDPTLIIHLVGSFEIDETLSLLVSS